MKIMYRIGRALAKGISHVVFRYKVINAPKVEGRALYCANHICFWDPFFLAMTTPRQINYMGKAELFRSKPIAALLRSVGAFPVVRGSVSTRAVRTANDLLENEEIVGIFPEGTRSKTGEMGNGKPGVAMLAYQHNATIVPAAICCASPHPRLFRKVLIVCGEPLTPDMLGIQTGSGLEYRNATRIIMRKIAELQTEGRKALNYQPTPVPSDGGKA